MSLILLANWLVFVPVALGTRLYHGEASQETASAALVEPTPSPTTIRYPITSTAMITEGLYDFYGNRVGSHTWTATYKLWPTAKPKYAPGGYTGKPVKDMPCNSPSPDVRCNEMGCQNMSQHYGYMDIVIPENWVSNPTCAVEMSIGKRGRTICMAGQCPIIDGMYVCPYNGGKADVLWSDQGFGRACSHPKANPSELIHFLGEPCQVDDIAPDCVFAEQRRFEG